MTDEKGPSPEVPDEIWDQKMETIELNGYIIDAETGEVVGMVDDTFHVTDEKSAEWVLEKMQQEDSEVAALTVRLQAIQENIETLRKRAAAKRAFLELKFGTELAEFAKTQLTGKLKSWTCPFGTVAFRSTPKRLAVVDEEKVLSWAKDHEPQAVKVTEKFLVSKLANKDIDAYCGIDGLQVIPEGESLTIKTGV